MRYIFKKTYPVSCIQNERGLPLRSNRYQGPVTLTQATSSQQLATRNSQPATGFTLLEILIAIFIFAVIVTTIFASFRTVFSNTDVIQTGQTYYETAKSCLNRMTIDLQSIHVVLPPAYTPPDLDAPPDPYRVVADTDYIKGQNFPRLRFTSLAHLPFTKNPHSGPAEIIYYVAATDENTFILKRSDNLYPLQTLGVKSSDPVLCQGVKTLQFKFYDQKETEYEIWDSESEAYGYATPKAVHIRLELDTGSESLLFETMVTLPVCREPKE